MDSVKTSINHNKGTVKRVQKIRAEFKEYAEKHIEYWYSIGQIADSWGYEPQTVHLMISGQGHYKGI